MKFITKTDSLKNITNTLIRISGKEDLGASLDGVYIEVAHGKVLFKVQRIDFGTLYLTDAEKTEDGSVFVSTQVLDGVVGSLIDTSATMELVGKKLIITTSTSTSEIHILNEEEKPELRQPEGKSSFSIRREVLIQGFRSVQHAAAESVVKPEIASVYMYTKNNSVYFVSTDAFRLAETRFLSEDDSKSDIEVIIPIKSVLKVVRVLESVSDTVVELYMQEGVVYFKTENALIRTNSVKGSFPDYKNIMPDDFGIEITVLRGDLTNFLKKARLFANKLNKLSISIEDPKTLSLEFSNETVGVTKNTVPAVIKGSVESLPSFNYKFLNDSLAVITDDRIILSAINDITKPIMIRGTDDTSFTAILSPLLEERAN